MRTQLVGLIQPGFVTATGHRHLRDLPRYLTGIARRLERLPGNAARDREWMDQVAQVQAEYADAVAQHRGHPELAEVRWMIEELRISLFAQELRTAYPVSAVRIYRILDAIPHAR
jgi:ATP-dependent helicase HrpA